MSTGAALFGLAGALALVLLNGFFVAVEFSVIAVRRTRVEYLAAEGNSTARLALKLLANPDRVIAASQLGITMASLALGWVGEATVAALIEPPLETLVGRWSVAAAHTVATGLAFALVTFTHIVLGEQAPKTIAIRYSETASLAIARPTEWFIRIFRPLIALLDGATSLVLRLLRVEPIGGHRTIYSVEELRMLVRESQEGGAIEEQQERLLQKAFAFSDRQVYEAMIPRPDVVGLQKEATIRDVLAVFDTSSHARFPVYGEDLDDIVGILAIKDVLRAIAQAPEGLQARVGSLVRPAIFVPETVAVSDLLTEMRASHNQMAIVIDEYGGTAGIVTLEELVEEIVGRLSDELVAKEEPLVRIDDRTVELDAQLRVDEANAQFNLDLPDEDDYETIAGLLLYRLQHIPAEGEALRCRGMDLKVTRMRGPKIERVQIRRVGHSKEPVASEQGKQQ